MLVSGRIVARGQDGEGGSSAIEEAEVAEEVASRIVLQGRKEIEEEAEGDEEGAADWASAMERDAFEVCWPVSIARPP